MLRRATPADRPALVALTLAEDAAWTDAAAISDEEVGELLDEFEPGVVFEHAGRVAGYAAIGEAGDTLLLVDPDIDPAPALDVLVGWFDEHGRRELDTYAADARRIGWFESRGLSHRRSSFDLGRGVDPPLAAPCWPAGVAVDPYQRGDDDEAVHALVYVDAGWGDVAGHSDRSLDAWRATLVPAGWSGRVARRDGRPVGWVVGRVFEDGRGWIHQLAVARAARRLGLGRALLLHSLADLGERGATSSALGVEADNDGALGLCRDIGFEVTREWRSYGPGDD